MKGIILEDFNCSYGESITDVKLQSIKFSEIAREIKTGNKVKDIILSIRSEPDKDKRNLLKRSLPYFNLGRFKKKRKNESLIDTQHMILDLDSLPEKELNRALVDFKNDRRVFACFISPSGHGLKIICKFSEPITNSEYYSQLYKYYAKSLANQYAPDKTSDCARACFFSYDPDLYINYDCELLPVELPKSTDDMAEKQPLSTQTALPPIMDIKTISTVSKGQKSVFYELVDKSATATLGSRSEADFATVAWGIKIGLSENEIWQHVQSVGKFNEKGFKYFKTTFENALKEVQTNQTAYTPHTEQTSTPAMNYTKNESFEYSNIETKKFSLSDVGNSERLVHYYGDQIRYNHTAKMWHIWNGKQWAEDELNKVNEFSKELSRKITKEAELSKGDEEGRYLKWALASMNEDRIRKAINLAKSDQAVAVTQRKFDSDHLLLNLNNGILNLETLELENHNPEKYLSKLAPVDYSKDAECPKFIDFLNRIFDNNQPVIQFLQKALAYSLTGKTGERCFFVLWGNGANGKTTLLNIIHYIMGDYATVTPVSTFMRKRDSIPNDLAALHSVRFVSASEGENKRRLNASLVKQISGGDPIKARFLHQEYFTFIPQFKVFLATNYKPSLSGSDDAIWDRVKLIPFTVTIPPEERKPDYYQELLEEAPGILNWLISGLEAYYEKGIVAPEDVVKATDVYRQESDELNEFLEECCIVGDEYEAKSSDLYKAYKSWCEGNGLNHESIKNFSQLLIKKNFENVRKKKGKFWQGIGIII